MFFVFCFLFCSLPTFFLHKSFVLCDYIRQKFNFFWIAQGQLNQSSTPGAPAAMMPTNINAIPQQVNAPAVSLSCNWTEHNSPEGFKYYYNSITRESKVKN
jgi:hypothetical protein